MTIPYHGKAMTITMLAAIIIPLCSESGMKSARSEADSLSASFAFSAVKNHPARIAQTCGRAHLVLLDRCCLLLLPFSQSCNLLSFQFRRKSPVARS
jgi:hypothetical protein